MESAMNATASELFGVVRTLGEHTVTRRSVVAMAIAIANFFLCAFYERYLVGPGWPEALVTLLALEMGILLAMAMAIQLQLINPILAKTAIHPVSSHSRFVFAVVTLLRHRYLVLFWGSSALSMTLMVHPSMTAAIMVAFTFLLPGVASVVISAALLVILRRWNSSGLVALALLAIIACITSTVTIVFPGSHILDIVMPLRWSVHACAAALEGRVGTSVLLMLPFATLAGIGWAGGSRYA
jgi:hypothetical protein